MADKIKSEISASQAMDDFKLVDGIGPVVEKRLHAAGVLTYTQLAHMKPDAIAKLLNGMVGYSTSRIKEQDWSGQAINLAEKTGPSFLDENLESTNNSLHYTSYTIELLLDGENQVRRTRAVHVQSHQEITWAGWDVARLSSFMVDSGQLQIASAQKEAHISKLASSSTSDLEPSPPAPALQGDTKIVETKLMNKAGQPLGALIPGNKPFGIQLILDLSQVEVPKGERLSYDATIYLKKMGINQREVTGEKKGSLESAKSAVIDISNQPLAPGDYRLEALVALRPKSQPKQLKNQLMAMTESMHLHVV
jgi:hypothetical protein